MPGAGCRTIAATFNAGYGDYQTVGKTYVDTLRKTAPHEWMPMRRAFQKSLESDKPNKNSEISFSDICLATKNDFAYGVRSTLQLVKQIFSNIPIFNRLFRCDALDLLVPRMAWFERVEFTKSAPKSCVALQSAARAWYWSNDG
jgi:hypothetical protein